jgi:hypothetical protein
VIRSASARISTASGIRSNGSSIGSSTVGGSRHVMRNAPPTSSPSSRLQPSGYGCAFMSHRVICSCFPGSTNWRTLLVAEIRRRSSHETLCRTGPVDGKHAGLRC